MRESPVTTVVAVLGLVIALFALINGCRGIDQERVDRQREVAILQRQTDLTGAGLRTVVVPGDPVIHGYHVQPNGSVEIDVHVINQSGSLALKGRLTFSAWVGPPPVFPFDVFGGG